jgi:glutamate 5-kinase
MSSKPAIEHLDAANRIVIKIGSSLLVDTNDKDLRRTWLAALASEIEALHQNGKQVVLVSSGAIALGLKSLGMTSRPSRLEDAQAAAAIGQIQLAQAYQSIFAENDRTIAQILITLSDLENRARYLNARSTVENLLEHDVLPVINENDTVATSEIRFGDNDRLAARVAQMIGADLLVLFSDIDGLYTADPNIDPSATLIKEVTSITPQIEAMAGPAGTTTAGSGGMTTKILAAKIALAGGCSMIIMNGTKPKPLTRMRDGEAATVFIASNDPLTLRKRWIQGMMAPKGFIHVDAGAITALKTGASLLPAGVTDVVGAFSRGDLVACISPEGHTIAQGLISYASADASMIAGVKSKDLESVLGYAGRASLIHRDDLVVL